MKDFNGFCWQQICKQIGFWQQIRWNPSITLFIAFSWPSHYIIHILYIFIDLNFNNFFWNSKGKSSGIGGTGKPLDELDQTCKTLSTCHSCIQLQHGEETCDPVTQKYKARLKKNDESGKVEIQCLNTMNKVKLLVSSKCYQIRVRKKIYYLSRKNAIKNCSERFK